MKQEKKMMTDTRDLRMSVEQIETLLDLLGPMDKITVDPDTAEELRIMLFSTLVETPDVLNDFTA